MKNNILDIIIINFNSTDFTIQCINSIYASAASFDMRIIVIDNGSCDNPVRIKQIFPQIEWVVNKSNIGFSKAVNIALKKASGEITVLLNPDTVIHDGFFSKAVEFLKQHEDIAVVGPKVLDLDGTVQGSARRFPTLLTSLFGRKSPLTKLFPNNPITKKEFLCFNDIGGKPIDVDWVSGACMVIRKKALDEVGGFDERYFLYWEDTDLCKELKNRGWRIVYLPEAEIYHHTGVSSNSEPIPSIINFHRSCYLLCEKHVKGLKRAIIPMAFCGLSVRCFLVMTINRYQSMIHKQKARPVKPNTPKLHPEHITDILLDNNLKNILSDVPVTESTAFSVPIVATEIHRIKKANSAVEDDEREQNKKAYNFPQFNHSDSQFIKRI